MLVVVLAAVTATFFLARVIPADPARLAAGLQAGPEQVEQVRTELGLDRPLGVQYVDYVAGLARLDFGDSIQTRRPVLDDLKVFVPPTVELVAVSFIVFASLGILLGAVWAFWPGGVLAALIRYGSVIGAAVPVFWVGLMLQLFFASRLGWFPVAGMLDYDDYDVSRHTGMSTMDSLLAFNLPAFGASLRHLALPVTAIVTISLATTTRLMRHSLVEQLNQPYVRTARARGIREGHIVRVDAMRNALNPVVTMLGLQFGWLLGSTILVEVMFSWPGLGMYAFNSFRSFDYSPIVAITIVTTVMFVTANEIVNAIYPLLDPRLRAGGRR